MNMQTENIFVIKTTLLCVGWHSQTCLGVKMMSTPVNNHHKTCIFKFNLRKQTQSVVNSYKYVDYNGISIIVVILATARSGKTGTACRRRKTDFVSREEPFSGSAI